jgi:lycopene beta-cyclase
MADTKNYDYVIAGGGCAGLSLVMRMIRSGHFTNKKILLIDKEQKRTNDRTWCFWEKGDGFFEEIVYHRWHSLEFFGENFSKTLLISPYIYKMVRGIDFYEYCHREISRHSNIEQVIADFGGTMEGEDGLLVILNGELQSVGSPVVFSSIALPGPDQPGGIRLLQHFKGWVIESPGANFDPGKATLMDFRVGQQHGTSFVYVLPFAKTQALVEYTQITRALASEEVYDAELNSYLSQLLKLDSYRVIEQEFGIIPMSSEPFPFYRNGVYHIGTAGGQTKPSTGYTFQFIQKQSALLVDCLLNNKPLSDAHVLSQRFRFYDQTFLRLLYYGMLPGRKVFSDLFRKNDPNRVLRFLDNESSFADDLKIIFSLPPWPFLKAAMRV